MVLEIREMGGTEDVRCRGEYTTGAARGRIGDNQKRIVHIHLIHIALIFCTNLSCSCSTKFKLIFSQAPRGGFR